MAKPSQNTASPQATALLQEAVERMLSAPRCFSQEEWAVLASYHGPVVSDDPEGQVPEDLEADDNE